MDSTFNETWCVDSETGEQILIDHKTGQIIARKFKDSEVWYEPRG